MPSSIPLYPHLLQRHERRSQLIKERLSFVMSVTSRTLQSTFPRTLKAKHRPCVSPSSHGLTRYSINSCLLLQPKSQPILFFLSKYFRNEIMIVVIFCLWIFIPIWFESFLLEPFINLIALFIYFFC